VRVEGGDGLRAEQELATEAMCCTRRRQVVVFQIIRKAMLEDALRRRGAKRGESSKMDESEADAVISVQCWRAKLDTQMLEVVASVVRVAPKLGSVDGRSPAEKLGCSNKRKI
jgi:hypothetical protein